MHKKQLVHFTICLLLILFAAELSTAQKPELVVQTGDPSWFLSVAFSPDGKTLASGSRDNTVKLKTKVADADHNGDVTLREWFNYASNRVPTLREETLQSKSLEEVTPTLRAAARNQKSQTPRIFYRRELEAQPFIVAKAGASN